VDERNSTLVLDPATLGKALTALSREIQTGQRWMPTNSANKIFLDWYYANWEGVEALQGLKVKTARQAAPLNSFLEDNGFQPMFREISPGGVGACAVIDMLVEWAVQATLTKFDIWADDYASHLRYTAFEVPLQGIEIFDLDATSEKLVKINTADGGALWLLMTVRPTHPTDFIMSAVLAMAARRPADTTWIKSVIVPTIEIDAIGDLSWMLGVSSGDHSIDQAFQLTKLRINHEGARVKAASGLSTTRGGPSAPQPLIFNRPFTGWVTQSGSELPIAVFYAGRGSWKKPGGALADL